MSETKPSNEVVPAGDLDQVAGGTDCGTTISAGTSGANMTHTDTSPGAALIAIYDGFVDVTSHIIGRIAEGDWR